MLACAGKSQIVPSSWAFTDEPVLQVLSKTSGFHRGCDQRKCDQIRFSERPSYDATRSWWQVWPPTSMVMEKFLPSARTYPANVAISTESGARSTLLT